MHHIAIMKKSLGLLPKVLSGEKKVESRWYKQKRAPWDRIKPGDLVYLKNAGEPVTCVAEVAVVSQFADLTPEKIKAILEEYGRGIGLSISEVQDFFPNVADKKYCLLIFLENPRPVEPFEISKAGFGLMSAWITIEDIHQVRR